jgi:hypothetical protein
VFVGGTRTTASGAIVSGGSRELGAEDAGADAGWSGGAVAYTSRSVSLAASPPHWEVDLPEPAIWTWRHSLHSETLLLLCFPFRRLDCRHRFGLCCSESEWLVLSIPGRMHFSGERGCRPSLRATTRPSQRNAHPTRRADVKIKKGIDVFCSDLRVFTSRPYPVPLLLSSRQVAEPGCVSSLI